MNEAPDISELESKLAFTERTVDSLSKSLYEVQSRLDRLENACRELGAQVKDLGEKMPGQPPADDKPPHY
jgi:uncharacterized coiled-coil protein SlyX